jgi:hypothetical protein
VVLLVNSPLMRSSDPEAMFQVGFCTMTFMLCTMMFVPAELVRLPFKDIRFPFNVNPLLANRSQPTVRLLKSLVLFVRVEPLKIRLSLLTGAVPPQFPPVLQLLSPPPPFHVLSAA